MIIPRFHYSYSFKDVYAGIVGVVKNEENLSTIVQPLFPRSDVYWVSSARVGIKYILKAFNLTKGAKVGIQPYTCSSVFAAIVAADLTPVFIDINENLSLSCEDLAVKITQIDALIVTHPFGFSADIPQIKKIAGHLPILEDCAHALFSCHTHHALGTFFDAAVFSFGNGKFPSLGGGGMLVVHNKALSRRLSGDLTKLPAPTPASELVHIIRSYANALLHSKFVQYILAFCLSERYLNQRNKEILTGELKESLIHKSTKKLLSVHLLNYQKHSEKQYQNGVYLATKLNGVYTFLTHGQHKVNYFSFVLLVKDRERLYRHLKKHGIMAGKHFHHALSWAMAYGYQKGECPSFEKYGDQILTVPCYYSLSKSEIDTIVHYLVDNRKMTP